MILPNRWRYLAVFIVCVIYAYGLSLTQPKWYKAEATLAFKNLSTGDQLDLTRLSSNPLPIFLEEAPIEGTYELSNIIYSVNMADRVIGDRFDELYDPSEYDGLIDFYDKFLLQAGYEYDGDKNVVTLSYIYKDPELAAEFCNDFATNLEDFVVGLVERSRISPGLRRRLATAREEAIAAEAELEAISEEYEIPDLIETPKGWLKDYAEALEKEYLSEAEFRSLQAALSEIRSMKVQRNLLEKDTAALPDTTISEDIILGALRFRLAMIKAVSRINRENTVEGSPSQTQLDDEISFLESYINEQYKYGLDVESRTLLMLLEQSMVEHYIRQARTEMTLDRLMTLPELEAVVRPVIRRANVANGTVETLERLAEMVEIGEEHGIDPIHVIDTAVAPSKPLPLWLGTLAYVTPTMLFLATLWFAFSERLMGEFSDEETVERIREEKESK